mgnify:CR=1 FL=1
MNANVIFRRFSVLLSAAIFVSLGAIAQAQTHPNLFRQRPVTATPGSHGVAAEVGDIDEAALTAEACRLDYCRARKAGSRIRSHGSRAARTEKYGLARPRSIGSRQRYPDAARRSPLRSH